LILSIKKPKGEKKNNTQTSPMARFGDN